MLTMGDTNQTATRRDIVILHWDQDIPQNVSRLTFPSTLLPQDISPRTFILGQFPWTSPTWTPQTLTAEKFPPTI